MKFSIHANKFGITLTSPATRNTHFFQVGFSFWNWLPTIKGPFLFIICDKRFEGISALGYLNMSY